MAYNFTSFDERASEVSDWLSKEFSTIRTGRATPALLDSIKVDSYGAKVPLNQVASVGVEDPRTLRISAWDSDSLQGIERAIIDADLGVSVVVDGTGARVIFPELSSERREQLLKIAKSKLEDARVSLRSARDETMKHVESELKSGNISEDEKFNAKEDLQKRVDTINSELVGMFDSKEKELNQ